MSASLARVCMILFGYSRCERSPSANRAKRETGISAAIAQGRKARGNNEKSSAPRKPSPRIAFRRIPKGLRAGSIYANPVARLLDKPAGFVPAPIRQPADAPTNRVAGKHCRFMAVPVHWLRGSHGSVDRQSSRDCRMDNHPALGSAIAPRRVFRHLGPGLPTSSQFGVFAPRASYSGRRALSSACTLRRWLG